MGRPSVGKYTFCVWCDVEFSWTGSKEPKYCSRLCYGAAQRAGVQINKPKAPKYFCGTCGQQFKPQNGSKSKYCSTECYHKSHATGNKSGKNVAWVKGWTALRNSIIERDGCCYICKSEDDLCVHHIVDREHNEPEDLIALCRKCHSDITHVENTARVADRLGVELLRKLVAGFDKLLSLIP